jgi:hypothetical protein
MAGVAAAPSGTIYHYLAPSGTIRRTPANGDVAALDSTGLLLAGMR